MVTKDKRLAVSVFVEDGEPRASIAGEKSFTQSLKFLCAFASASVARTRDVHIGRIKNVLQIQSDERPGIAFLVPNDGTRLYFNDAEVSGIEIHARSRNHFDRAVAISLETKASLKHDDTQSTETDKASETGSRKKERKKPLREEKSPIRQLKLFGNPHVPIALAGSSPFNFLTVFDENTEEEAGEQEIVLEGQVVAYGTRVPNRPKTFEIRPADGIRLLDADDKEWPFLLLIFRSAGAKRLAKDGVQGIRESVL